MKINIEDLRRHYASLSDQALRAIDRTELVEIARGCYDQELAQRVTIMYGGSVKPGNARELFAMADVDGGLIGGASLVAEDFIAICAAARR